MLSMSFGVHTSTWNKRFPSSPVYHDEVGIMGLGSVALIDLASSSRETTAALPLMLKLGPQ